jgi:hypothetical protein
MGYTMAFYALSSIVGAITYNPSKFYLGTGPIFGIYLRVGHPLYFYLILGMICGCHLAFMIAVAVLTNKVKVGPNGYLTMGILLQPVAAALESHQAAPKGKDKDGFRDVKRNTIAIYEMSQARGGKWGLTLTEGGNELELKEIRQRQSWVRSP